jgi:ketosteroid isomerase-like protein
MLVDARDAFRRFQESVLRNEHGNVALRSADCADDVLIEVPFNPPGQRRYVGIDAFEAAFGETRAALPIRFDEFRDVVIHQSTDPDVIVAEYDLVGTHTGTGRQSTASFVMMLRVRDGKLVHSREYQDRNAIAAALRDEKPED